MTGVLMRERVGPTHRGKTGREHREKVATYKPRREASEETKPTNTLILNVQPPELCGEKFLLLKPLSLWYVVWQLEQRNRHKKVMS